MINIGSLKENLEFLRYAKDLALKNLSSSETNSTKLNQKDKKDNINLNLNLNFNFNIKPEDVDCI